MTWALTGGRGRVAKGGGVEYLRCTLSALAMALVACGPGDQQVKTGSQTNWLRGCSADSECGELLCLCGLCSAPCEDDAACRGLEGASCVAASDVGAIAVCGGAAPSSALCLPRCDEQSCAGGTSCLAGVCGADLAPDVHLKVDLSQRHQILVGFGASLAYAEDAIVGHPLGTALYDAMFAESGFEVVRLRNRYEGDSDALTPASEILSEAAVRLRHAPTLFMTAGSPPAELKANGSRVCSGNADLCTLATLSDGTFDYQGLADHWLVSLEAHAAAGIFPDYLSIQNDPDWVPDESSSNEACWFLPTEGLATLETDNGALDVPLPGYREALAAVRGVIGGLERLPTIVAPEVTTLDGVQDYTTTLPEDSYAALALHLYGVDPAAIELEHFERIRVLAQELAYPVFQTEMRAEGLDTAVLAHYALTVADAEVYLQNDFVSPASRTDGDPNALIGLTMDGFELQEPYHALRHYAHKTAPGWARVEAIADSSQVLCSAWVSPAEDALTVVIVNPSAVAMALQLEIPAELRRELTQVEVTRTVFEGVERSTDLGALGSNNILQLPSGSVVTVSLTP